MDYKVISDRSYDVAIDRESNNTDTYKVTVDGETFQVQVLEKHTNGHMRTLVVNNHLVPVNVQRHADGIPKTVFLKGFPFEVEIERVKAVVKKPLIMKKKACGDIKATLPGEVLEIMVKIGDKIEKGDPVLILESMKMENELVSPKDGVVAKILVQVGQSVKKDEIMIQVN